MIQKYKKKPVEIEAIQWTGENTKEIFLFGLKQEFTEETIDEIKLPSGELYIMTLEGTMIASKGDYIIKGIKGEFYPCKPDIFLATYDKVIY